MADDEHQPAGEWVVRMSDGDYFAHDNLDAVFDEARELIEARDHLSGDETHVGTIGRRTAVEFPVRRGGDDGEGKELDKVYEDRNLLACALAVATDASSGWKPDPDNPDEWAIVWVETPVSQVSWHVPQPVAASSPLPLEQSGYDGYDREEKNQRLYEWFKKGCPRGER